MWSTRSMKGSDVTRIGGAGGELRILHAAVVGPASPVPLVKLFATIDGPASMETAMAAWPKIRELFPTAFIQLNLRRDPFHRGAGFPALYPFWRTSALPDRADALRKNVARCYADAQGTPKCRLEVALEPW